MRWSCQGEATSPRRIRTLPCGQGPRAVVAGEFSQRPRSGRLSTTAMARPAIPAHLRQSRDRDHRTRREEQVVIDDNVIAATGHAAAAYEQLAEFNRATMHTRDAHPSD